MSDLSNDNRADVNPFKVGGFIYSHISEYFMGKWGLKYVENFPKEPLNSPVITWRILRRTPGGGKNGMAQGKGANYARTLGKDGQGQVVEQYKQQHRILLDFIVIGMSSSALDDIAWDLENAIVDCEGELQKKIEGFSISFDQQTGDSSYEWKDQLISPKIDLLSRCVRFVVVLPVRYRVISPELKQIKVNTAVGQVRGNSGLLTRTTDEAIYTLPEPEIGGKITSIHAVRKAQPSSTALMNLYPGIDYQGYETTDGTIKLKWLDENGATPKIGEYFTVDYTFAPLTTVDVQYGPKIEFDEVVKEIDEKYLINPPLLQ